ncbi:hypothetical protein ACU4GD_12320 [Cupriavidus basilensis]
MKRTSRTKQAAPDATPSAASALLLDQQFCFSVYASVACAEQAVPQAAGAAAA